MRTALGSCRLASFRRLLWRGLRFFPRSCCDRSRFGRRFNQRRQFQLFRIAVMATVQGLNARGFIFPAQLSVAIFLALILKVFRNRFRRHSQECDRTDVCALSNLALRPTVCNIEQNWVANQRTLFVLRSDDRLKPPPSKQSCRAQQAGRHHSCDRRPRLWTSPISCRRKPNVP